MKQHITWEQIKECNLIKLRQLIDDEVFDDMVIGYFDKKDELQEEYFINKIIEYLNIGKMVEIIKNNGYKHIEFCEQDKRYKNKKWYVGLRAYKDIVVIENFGETICDALWEGTKFVLEEDS